MAVKKKFGRVVELYLNNETSPIKNIRMNFRVERFFGDVFAHMKIELYNLDRRKQSATDEGELIVKRGDFIQLFAGYEGALSKIFSGYIRNVNSVKQDVDRVVTAWCADTLGAEPISINLTIGNPKSIKNVIIDLAKSVGIPIGAIRISSRGMLNHYTATKTFNAIMDELGRTYEFDWYILDGQLYIFEHKYVGTDVLRINSGTGLLESPTVTLIGTDVKLLLESSLKPNDFFEVGSAGVVYSQGNLEVTDLFERGLGIQRVLSLVHTGDTHSNIWYTEVIGKKVDPTESGAIQ